MSDTRDTVRKLRQRVRELEAILQCVECGHLRSEHEGDDSPCFGGRTEDMKDGEGYYCDCDGFVSESTRAAIPPQEKGQE